MRYDPTSPEFQRLWAKLVARAWAEPEFMARVQSDPRAVLQDYGVEVPEDVTVSLADSDLAQAATGPADAAAGQDAIQGAAGATQAAATQALHTLGPIPGGVSSTTLGREEVNMAQNQAMTLATVPTVGTAQSQGTVACLGAGPGGQASSTNLGGSTVGSAGSAASAGTIGCVCGTVGTAGTIGTAGTAGTAGAAPGAAQGASSSVGTQGSICSTAGTAGSAGICFGGAPGMAQGGASTVGSVGSVGCVGTVGSVCGTAATAGTVGTGGTAGSN
jgi:hypothetical protein